MADVDAKELFNEDDLFEGRAEVDETPKTAPTYKRTLEQWKLRFTDFQSTMQDPRKKQETNYKYYYGEQLTPSERDKLEARGQPDVVINRLKVAINGIMGVEKHSSTSPLALPVRPLDEGSSDVATDILRFVARKNRLKNELTANHRDYLLGGCTAMLVGFTDDNDVDYVPIRWEEFFYDPRSRREDFRDARYMGTAKWMYADEVKELTSDPEFHRQVDSAFDQGMVGRSGNGTDDTFEDRPVDQGWLDARTKRVMVVEIYEKVKGVWTQCVFWDGGILQEQDSPYLDAKGRPTNPIVAQSCYVNLQNHRMGYASDLIDLQDEINKRRQKSLWEVSSNQIEAADPSAIEVSADEARREAARPDGVIPYGWKKVAGTDKSAGNMALLAEAKNEMERFSPNPAMLGRQGADTSGKALLARQQAGLIELAVVMDQFDDFKLRLYLSTWERVRQGWTEPMVLRLTDDPEDLQFLEINQPKPPTPEQPLLDESGQPVLDLAGQPVIVPAMEGEELGYKNRVAEMDVDIMIDTAPETASIREAQMAELRQVLATNPAYAQQVPFEVIMDLTNLPRKREIMKKIKAFREAQEAATAEAQKKQEQIATATAEAEIAKLGSETLRNEAEAHAKVEGAKQGEIRTAVQADKTLAGIDAEATRVQIDGAKATNEILSTPKPAAGDETGEDGPPTE